jgi:N-acetylmuramoyl-L-alanine amidase
MLIFYMKKIAFFLFLVMFMSHASGEERHGLKLRASHHPEFLRVVIEGARPVLSKAIVNQTGEEILVRFPYTKFSIEEEKGPLNYRIKDDTLIFSHGNFNKFKVFSLDFPSRLILDVHLITFKKDIPPTQRKSTQGQIRRIRMIGNFVIDPGHGGYNQGVKDGTYKEKNVVLDIAKKLKVLLNRGSTQCLLTRESDQFMSLKKRIKFANRNGAEIFLSIHIGNHREIILYTPVISDPLSLYDSKLSLMREPKEHAALRISLQKTLKEEFGDEMVTMKPLPYSILSKIDAAALIIELPSFKGVPYDEEFKTTVANTIYRGLYQYEESTAY